MKILFISPQPFFRVRGTPINVRRVVETLGSEGHHVDLLCYPMGETLSIPGVHIIRAPRFPGIKDVGVGFSPAKMLLDLMIFFKAISLCLKTQYDVIHAVEEAAFFAPWLPRQKRAKRVYDMDSLISDQLAYSGTIRFKPLIRFIEGMERRLALRADVVLTVCQSLTDQVKKMAPDARIEQIEDAPLEEAFREDKARENELRQKWDLVDQRVVLYTGNLESYQGIEMLIDAIPYAFLEKQHARMLIVGGEPQQMQSLQQRAEQAGVGHLVRFTGKQPMEDMAAYMTMAELLVSPRTEGTNTALKIYGYMQSGRPIVATRLETHTQVLDTSCSFLTEKSPRAFGEGLRDALQDPEEAKKRGGVAKEKVDTLYSLKVFREKVSKLYRSL